MTSVTRNMFNLSAHQRPMVGDTKTSVLSVDHLGWLFCDGRELSVSSWTFLFNVIGYSFGSNTSNYFKLPNPAGRVPGFIGSNGIPDTNNELTNRALGALAGEERHTLIRNEMPAHTHGSNAATGNNDGSGNTSSDGLHNHTVNDPGHDHSYTTYVNADRGYVAAGENDGVLGGTQTLSTTTSFTGISTVSSGTHYHTISTTGGGAPHNNIQPTLFLGNLFIYSGKESFGAYPFTQGIYSTIGAVPSGFNLV
jgi:microcystin-dependent protein